MTVHSLHISSVIMAGSSMLAGVLSQVPEMVPLAMLAGLAGGICAALADWIVDAVPLTWRALGHAVVGALVAGFLYPLGQPIMAGILGPFDLDPAVSVMFGGFVIGVAGISIIVLLRDAARARLRRQLREQESGVGKNDGV